MGKGSKIHVFLLPPGSEYEPFQLLPSILLGVALCTPDRVLHLLGLASISVPESSFNNPSFFLLTLTQAA